MRKIFSVIILTAMIFICGQTKIEAADIWLYTDKNGAEYYLRDCSLPARSWSFAHVIKVKGNNITDLAYHFEMVGDVHYSVCIGSTAYVFMSRESHPTLEVPLLIEFGIIILNKWNRNVGHALTLMKIVEDKKRRS